MAHRILRALALIVLAFVAGALLNPFSSDASARPPKGEADDLPFWAPTTSTTRDTETPPVVDPRTEDGAVAAAAAFVCTGQQLIEMSDDEIDTFLRERVTRSAADRVIEEHQRDVAALREALARGSGPTVYREAVVAYRVDAFNEDEARIAIWHVGVLARSHVAPPQAGWMVSTVDLRWERNGWRVVGEIAVPGPAPILNDGAPPATAEELLDQLDGFTDFGGAT